MATTSSASSTACGLTAWVEREPITFASNDLAAAFDDAQYTAREGTMPGRVDHR